MDKRIIIITCLIGTLILSFTIFPVSAAADKGVDMVEEGDKFNYSKTIRKNIKEERIQTGDVFKNEDYTYDSLLMNVTGVDNHTIDMTERSYSGEFNKHYDDNDQMGYSFSYHDDDNDGNMESVNFFINNAYPYVLASNWTTYTEKIVDLKQELEWAKGNVSSFDFFFEIDNTSQKIEIELDFKWEQYPWQGSYNESVIYDSSRGYKINWDNFILNRYHYYYEYSVNSIVNSTYLSDQDEQIVIDKSHNYIFSREVGGEEIPGFGILSLLSVSSMTIIGLMYISKRKKQN